MIVDNAFSILSRSNVNFKTYWAADSRAVYISDGNQLFGEKSTFDSRSFRSAFPAYIGWEAHHILEFQDVQRLGLTHKFPSYKEQICVLIPSAGHRGRINSRLRILTPIGVKDISKTEFIDSYQDAYQCLGNYCGSSEHMIVNELMSVVKTLIHS